MTARIYWYPAPGADLRELDLGRALSDLAQSVGTRAATSETASGRRAMAVWTQLHQVRASAEKLQDRATIRELQAIEAHLKTNGVVALAEDDGAMWGGYAVAPPSAGATSLEIDDNLWSLWGTPTITAGDTVIVQSPSPSFLWEESVVASRSGNALTLADGLIHDYTDEPWVFVRDRRFWPWLRLQTGALAAPLLRTSHRITWTWDASLEEPPSRLAETAGDRGSFRGAGDHGGRDYHDELGRYEGALTVGAYTVRS